MAKKYARLAALTVLLAALGGCAVQNVFVTPGSAHIEQIGGDYQRVATCTYQRLSGRGSNTLTWKPDTRRRLIEISSTENEKVKWRLELRQAARRQTEVMIPLPRTVGAATPDDLLPDVRACAGR